MTYKGTQIQSTVRGRDKARRMMHGYTTVVAVYDDERDKRTRALDVERKSVLPGGRNRLGRDRQRKERG